MKLTKFILFLILFTCVHHAQSQVNSNRFIELEKRLDTLAKSVNGLNQKVDFSVTGITIQDFLRAMAESNNLNISIDPKINTRIYNNFNNEEAKNVILFLCKEYNLDIRFVGSIMSVFPYQAAPVPIEKIKPKEINVTYNDSTGTLSLSLRKDTLFKVLESITVMSSKNVITDPEVSDLQLISAFIQNMPFENALEKMAFTNNLSLEITADSFYVIKKRPKEEEISTTNSNYSKNNSNKNAYNSSLKSSNGNFYLEVKDSMGTKLVSFSADDMSISDVISETSKAAEKNF